MLVVKNFLLCQKQINFNSISIAAKLDSRADNNILCMYFTVASPPVVESNVRCSHWSCTYHLDLGWVSNLGLNVPFSSSYTRSLPCEILQLNTVCSIPQSKQQSHLPFKYTPYWPPRRAASQDRNIYGKQCCLFLSWSQHGGSSKDWVPSSLSQVQGLSISLCLPGGNWLLFPWVVRFLSQSLHTGIQTSSSFFSNKSQHTDKPQGPFF